MDNQRLLPTAWVALCLRALYVAATALCGVFISVYLWVNSFDFSVVCRYYLAVYTITPGIFLLAGWYSQARDRLHVYRLGLVLHAIFYGLLLLLRERSPEYATLLGAFLGVAWGVFWAGANTLDFDVTLEGRREYYFGLLSSTSGLVSLLCPMIAGLIIRYVGDEREGYLWIFALSAMLYLGGFTLSFLMPSDNTRRPFRIWRALLPGRDQRDWRLIMLASMSLAGSFNIFMFLLGLLMYMQTGNELTVGGYASFQALASVIVAFFVGRWVTPRTRRRYMFLGVAVLLVAGSLMAFKLTIVTLVLFGLLRSISMPMFGIPHSGLRMDIIAKSAENPAQRIEYISAWEVPLAIGRVIMMLVMLGLFNLLSESEIGLRITIFILCAIRIVTYQLVTRTSALNGDSRSA